MTIQSDDRLIGKIPPEILELVLRRTGSSDPDVVLGPAYGEDAAAVRVAKDLLLVSHSDPITAASSDAGWLSVHVACNDVATRGSRPRWLLSVILLPENPGWREVLDNVTGQIDSAAKSLGVAVVGGHTEVAPGLRSPVIVATCMGLVAENKLVTTSGAKPGDLLLMTKTAGVEGTAIIASDYGWLLRSLGVDEETLRKAVSMRREISIVPEALLLAEHGLANSMHDPTEGGILGGALEMARASGNTIIVYEDRVPVAETTRRIAEAVKVDPLRLISSGSLLASVPSKRINEALELLHSNGITARVIGEVVEGEPLLRLVHRNGSVEEFTHHSVDEIYRVPRIVEALAKKLGLEPGRNTVEAK